jgi:TPR repeat protein
MMQEEEHEEAARAKQKAEAVMSEIRAQQRSNQKVRRRVVKDAKASGASRTQGDTMTALITELDVKANSMRMKGVEWLLKAHQQGYASSTVALANVMYENIQNGQGSIDQLKKVITLWSSVSPHPDACFNLGKLYYDGIPSISEFETNKGVSFEWFQSAAQEGDAASQYWLGYMHHVGDEECGVVPNRDVALMMLKSASDQRHIDASIYLYTLYRNGDSAIEVDASDSKALHYLHVAKEQGSDEAYNVLGDLYFHGTEMGIDVNLTESLKSYLKSGELGNSFALCSAAAMYHHGYGAERDWIKSYQLYQLAVDCDSDNKEAWRNLASCYYYGHGTKQDVELAKTILNTVLKKDEIKA